MSPGDGSFVMVPNWLWQAEWVTFGAIEAWCAIAHFAWNHDDVTTRPLEDLVAVAGAGEASIRVGINLLAEHQAITKTRDGNRWALRLHWDPIRPVVDQAGTLPELLETGEVRASADAARSTPERLYRRLLETLGPDHRLTLEAAANLGITAMESIAPDSIAMDSVADRDGIHRADISSRDREEEGPTAMESIAVAVENVASR